MARPKTAAEIRITAACMRLDKAAKKSLPLATASGQHEHAASMLDVTRAEAVRAIADALPLLTAEQREQLRPILSGSVPAELAQAEGAA